MDGSSFYLEKIIVEIKIIIENFILNKLSEYLFLHKCANYCMKEFSFVESRGKGQP